MYWPLTATVSPRYHLCRIESLSGRFLHEGGRNLAHLLWQKEECVCTMGFAWVSAAHGGGRHREQRPAEGRRRPRILVVDDDDDDRQLYGMMLCYNGFDVVFAGSIRAGREMAREYAPDAILLDLGLPDGNGLELCASLNRNPGTMRPPVLVLSGFRRDELGETATRYGCADYIEKPASPLDVMHRIETLVGKPPLAGDGEPPAVLAQRD